MSARGGVSLKTLAESAKPESGMRTFARLTSYLTPYKRSLLIATIWLIVSSASTAALPALIGLAIDVAIAQASGARNTAALNVPIALLIGATIAGWYAQRAQILALGAVGQHALFELRGDVFSSLGKLSIAYFESAMSGDIMSRLINDVETVNSFLSQGLRRLISSFLATIATVAGMFFVEWRLALVTLAAVPLMLVVTRFFAHISRGAFRRRQQTISDVSSALSEEIAGIKVTQAFDRAEQNRDTFDARNAANRDANISAATVAAAFTPTLVLLTTITTVLVIAYGGSLVSVEIVTVGTIVAFISYSRQFFNAVTQLSSLYTETQSALAGGERVFALVDTEGEINDAANPIELDRVRGDIEYRGVHFRYSSGPEVLTNINLTVQAGTTVAIAGETGAGKSTLLDLIPRFYDVTKGAVLIDGTDVRSVSMKSLRKNLGIVGQDPFLFAGTIYDNIRYGRLDASHADIVSAAKAAGALEFIEKLEEGFEAKIHERGRTLSSGQRQLISLARAILSDPAVLLLDEATASVDTKTEVSIQSALKRLLAGRTSLIIAHRLSTVRNADLIIVLDKGRIVETGTYNELMAANGHFAAFLQAQFPDA